MSLTAIQAALEARNLLTEESESAIGLTLPNITAMIPTALSAWVMDAFNDSFKREQFKKNITVTLSSGTADLTNYVNGATNKINLKDLRATTVYTTISGVRTPLTWVASQAQLNNLRQVGKDAPACFLDGYTLRTRNIDGSQTSLGAATVNFTVVDIPATVSTIPTTDLERDFIGFLAQFISNQLITKKQA